MSEEQINPFLGLRAFYTTAVSDQTYALFIKDEALREVVREHDYSRIVTARNDMLDEKPGAASAFVAQLSDRNFHPDRELIIVHLATNTVTNEHYGIALNPLSAGVCCVGLVKKTADGKTELTAIRRNDITAVQELPDGSHEAMFEYWDRSAGEITWGTVPFDGTTTFVEPPTILPLDPNSAANTEKPILDWLAQCGVRPDRFNLKTGQQAFLTSEAG